MTCIYHSHSVNWFRKKRGHYWKSIIRKTISFQSSLTGKCNLVGGKTKDNELGRKLKRANYLDYLSPLVFEPNSFYSSFHSNLLPRETKDMRIFRERLLISEDEAVFLISIGYTCNEYLKLTANLFSSLYY